jgi:pimeloyl-ACP methyl ester carboxylesterase
MDQDEVVVTVAGSAVRAFRTPDLPDGPAIVLLHGGSFDSARLSWEPMWSRLAPTAQLVAPDLPGYGASVLGATRPTLTGYRDWLLTFLDACELHTVVIVGLSMGGGIALQTALDAPDRISALVLCAPYGVSERTPGGRAGAVAVHAPGLTPLTNTILRRSPWLLRRAIGTLLRRPDAVTDELVSQVAAELTQPHSGAAWSSFRRHEVRWSGPRTRFGDELARLGQPAVFLSGERDHLVPAADVRAAAARVPRGRFVTVPGAGHWLPRDAPDLLAAEIAAISGR